MAGDKKLAIQPIIGCVASLVVALMFLLPLMVTDYPSPLKDVTSNLFDFLEAFFDGAKITTLVTATTIVLYLTHLVAIVSAVLFGICIFTGNEKLLNIAKIMSYVLAGLALVGLILAFIMVADFNKDLPKDIFKIGVAPILAAVFAIGSAVCSFVLKK